jgi:ribosomal protein S18 acetylase RimI-like enzyme
MPDETGVRVRRALAGDEDEIARFEEAFDNRMLPDETRRFLEDERHHLLLGYVDDRPAGFLSAVEVFHPDKRSELFLNEVAVMEETRRQGVARALLDELKRVGRERGCVSMWVLTDEDNAGAMRLYRSTGGVWNGDPAVMFEYDLADDEASHAT